MKAVRIAALLALAGASTSFGQTLDGKLAGDASAYGPARFTQNQPTSLCDNNAALCSPLGGGVRWAINNSNAAGVPGGGGTLLTPAEQAAAAAVATGLEIAIPVSQLGALGSTIRVTGWVNGGGSDYLSNQVIGGFTTDRGNLGGDGNGGFNGAVAINWPSIAGDQFASIANPGAFPALAITLDGSRDAAYPAPQFVQTNQTQFGDGTAGLADCPGGGSEIANLSVTFGNADLGDGAQNYVFIFVGGNLECNFNRLNLIIDNGSGTGQPTIGGCLPGADGLSRHIGMTFDAPFRANYYLSFRNGGGPASIFADFARIDGSGSGGFVGGGLTGGTSIAGSATACPPSETASNGSELNQVFARVDRAAGRLKLLITGNLRQDDFIHLFFDTRPGGQNAILDDNVRVGIADGDRGHLPRFGPLTVGGPALTFDSNFAADYWLASHFENGNRQVIDAAVLRTDGREEIPSSSAAYDYGSYQGVDSPGEINFNGTNFTDQNAAINNLPDGSLPNLFSQYAPTESRRVLDLFRSQNGGLFPTDPTAWSTFLSTNATTGLIRGRFSNSNVLGVTESSAAGAATADAGFEYDIALSEIGWQAGTPIRLAGFIAYSSTRVISSQVIGGSGQATDLGDPRNVNFQTIAGNQYVVVLCPPDVNSDGNVTVQDIFDFLGFYFANNLTADYNGSGSLTVQDIFDFLTGYFAGGCN